MYIQIYNSVFQGEMIAWKDYFRCYTKNKILFNIYVHDKIVEKGYNHARSIGFLPKISIVCDGASGFYPIRYSLELFKTQEGQNTTT